MGYEGEYVVGFVGSDGTLGRTISGEYNVAIEAMEVLFDENEDVAPPPEYWEDNCSYRSDMGTYFFGGLEYYTQSTVCNC
jgi:hypothetical protein